ncbi:MAG: hypothetical protein ACHQE6_07445 [Solirubrobacterales bacterium]
MAYVVARRNGRFEVRESLYTRKGPRAHTLAGFDVLTDEILRKAAAKAERPFDAHAVLASGRRAGAPVTATIGAKGSAEASEAAGAQSRAGAGSERGGSASRFVESSRRMALALRRTAAAGRIDPGTALIDLLGFADAVTRGRPARPFEPLTFPVLRQLAEHHSGAAVTHRG